MILDNTTLKIKRNSGNSILNNQVMIHNLSHYIKETYGHQVWHILTKENQKIFTRDTEIYGDAIFQLIVDIVSRKIRQPIGYIIHDFSLFLDKFQN